MAKVALLIGNSEYEPGLNPLPNAVKDVDAVKEVLLNPDLGGFAESNITVLKNCERQEMETAIEELFSGRRKDDLVVMYFSGHGIKDDRGRLFFATRTTSKTPQGELRRSTAVSARVIHDRMSESRSKRQVVILDSCFSGAFGEGMSAKDDGTVHIREQLGGEGRAVLASSSSTQYSFEEQEDDLSIYTRFLIQGIKTGEADLDDDEHISIEELHEYATQKVRELQPAMKPEIHAIREGYKIRFAKVPPLEPVQRYRKEVERYIRRGEITFVGRSSLDYMQAQYGLDAGECKAIENEILEPYRKAFREKLQRYEQAFRGLLERGTDISEGDRQDLQRLQQSLELRNEDTVPLEAEVTAQFKNRQQNLKAYEQSFSDALRKEYPLGEEARHSFIVMQQQLDLRPDDVAPIEAKLIAEFEEYRQKLNQYEQDFRAAAKQAYPLSAAKRSELQRRVRELGLTDVDVAPTEAKITSQIETLQQKIEQYKEAFVKATERKHHPDEVARNQLKQMWQTLELGEADVRAIESAIVDQINTYQLNLQKYEEEFTQAMQQQYPLDEVGIRKLQQLQQTLSLFDEDVDPIVSRITKAREELLHKLQQYEQVFFEQIQLEYPLTDETRDELKRFQKILELSDEAIIQIEERVLEQNRSESPQVVEVDSNGFESHEKNSSESFQAEVQSKIFKPEVQHNSDHQAEEAVLKPIESSAQAKTSYEERLKRYEQEFTIFIAGSLSGVPTLTGSDQLKKLQSDLDLSDVDVKQIESKILEKRSLYTSQTSKSIPKPLECQGKVQRDCSYLQKIIQYEKEFMRIAGSSLSGVPTLTGSAQLKRLQSDLDLSDIEVKQIESKILGKRSLHTSQTSKSIPKPLDLQAHEFQDATYQERLSKYTQKVDKIVSRGIPLDDLYIRRQLNRLQLELSLNDTDVDRIEKNFIRDRQSGKERV